MVERSLQKLDNPLECWHESLESARKDAITHLSTDSLFVATERVPKAGLPVFLELALSQTENPAKAMIDGVVTSEVAPDGQSGFGVHFVRIDDAVRVWIEHTLRSVEVGDDFAPFGQAPNKEVPEEISVITEPLNALDEAKTDAHFRPEFDSAPFAQLEDIESLDEVEADALLDPSAEDEAFTSSLGFPASEAFPKLDGLAALSPPPVAEFGEDSFGLVHPEEPTQTLGSVFNEDSIPPPKAPELQDEASPFSLESFEPTPFEPEPTGDIDPFDPVDSAEVPLAPISAEEIMDSNDRAILESPFFQTESAFPEPEVRQKTPPLGSDSRHVPVNDLNDDPPELHLHAAFQPAVADEDLDRTQGYDSELSPAHLQDSSARVRSITDDTMQMPTPEAGPRASFGIEDEGPTETLQMLAVNPAAAALEALTQLSPPDVASPSETLQMGAVDPFASVEPSAELQAEADPSVVALPAGISREGSPVESTQRYVVERAAPAENESELASSASVDLSELPDEASLDAAAFNDEAFADMFAAPGESSHLVDEPSNEQSVSSDLEEPSNDPFAEVAGVVSIDIDEPMDGSGDSDASLFAPSDPLQDPIAPQAQPSVVLNAEALGLLGHPEDAMVLELGQPLGEFPFGQAQQPSEDPAPPVQDTSFPEPQAVGTAPFASSSPPSELPQLRQPADSADPFLVQASPEAQVVDPFVDDDAEFDIDDAEEPMLSDLNITPLPGAALDGAAPLFDPSPKAALPSSGDWRVLESAAPTPAPPQGAPQLVVDDPFNSDEDFEVDVDLDFDDDDLPVVVGSSRAIEETSSDEEWTSS